MVVFTAIDHYAPIVEHILSLASGTGRHAFMIHLDDILATSQRIACPHTVWTLCIISNKSAVWRRIKGLIAHNDAVADLQKSIRIGGNSDAFAYPYGDYNDSCIQAVKDAGFKCAVTTEYGRAKVGDDPLVLPRIRMLRGQSLDSFKKLVE